jgi:ABC-type Zn uptake system ZnuABC Zn-binding protein ZnuA
MHKRYIIVGLAVVLCLLSVSCQRVTPQAASSNLVDLKNIPAAYGNLVSVTSIPAYPEWVQMWFQDSAGTIRIIKVSFKDNRMITEATTITRS